MKKVVKQTSSRRWFHDLWRHNLFHLTQISSTHARSLMQAHTRAVDIKLFSENEKKIDERTWTVCGARDKRQAVQKNHSGKMQKTHNRIKLLFNFMKPNLVYISLLIFFSLPPRKHSYSSSNKTTNISAQETLERKQKAVETKAEKFMQIENFSFLSIGKICVFWFHESLQRKTIKK